MTRSDSTGAGPRWGTIWFAPRATLRAILERNPSYAVMALAAVGGVVWLFFRADAAGLASHLPFLAVMAIVGAGGIALGVFKLFLGGWLTAWIGRWFDGAGTARSLRAALAWGSVPAVACGLFAVILVLAVDRGVFINEDLELMQADLRSLLLPFETEPARADEASLVATLLVAMASLLAVTGLLWTVVTTVKCIAEAHGFSSWRAIVTLVVTYLTAGLVLIVPYLGLVTFAVIADACAGGPS